MFRKSNDSRRKRADNRPPNKTTRKIRRNRGGIHLLGGLVAGVVGGIVATWVLDIYQRGALEATRRAENAVGAGPVLSRHQEAQMRSQERAHLQTAQSIVKSTIGRRLSRAQRRGAAPVVHYAIGALAGGVYGLAAELLPVVRRGYGTGYASLLFLGSSQALIPGFGFGPQKSSGDGLSGHLVYGATLETTRRVLRSFL
jgi:putative membrane protein